MSSVTASLRLVGLAHLGRASGGPACAMRAYSASRSSSVDLELLGRGDGAQGEVDLDRLLATARCRLSTKRGGVLAGGRQPLVDGDALGLELLHGVLHPAAAGRPAPSTRAARCRPARPAPTVARSMNWLRAWLSLVVADALGERGRATPRPCRTRRCSRRPTRRSARAASVSCTFDDLDGEVGRLARCRSGVAVNVSSSPARGADAARSSKPSATQPLPTSYSQSSVLRPATGSPSRVPARSRVTDRPIATGGRRRPACRAGAARPRPPRRCRIARAGFACRRRSRSAMG